MCVRACLGPLIIKVYPLLKLHCKEMYIRECGGFSNWFGCLCLEGAALVDGEQAYDERGGSESATQPASSPAFSSPFNVFIHPHITYFYTEQGVVSIDLKPGLPLLLYKTPPNSIRPKVFFQLDLSHCLLM